MRMTCLLMLWPKFPSTLVKIRSFQKQSTKTHDSDSLEKHGLLELDPPWPLRSTVNRTSGFRCPRVSVHNAAALALRTELHVHVIRSFNHVDEGVRNPARVITHP